MSEPQNYSYRPLPATRQESKAVWKEMIEIQRKGGATFFRYTFFDDDHPSPIYPHGLYLEGWDSYPKDQGEFNFPVQYASGPPHSIHSRRSEGGA